MSNTLKPVNIDKSAFEIEEADELIQEGQALAQNDVTVNRAPVDRSRALVAAAGDAITDRIGAKDTVSALQAKQLQNQAANYRFAPGTSLAERLNQANQLNAQAAAKGADAVQKEGQRRVALGMFAKQANLAASIKLQEYQNRAEAANMETELAVRQGSGALRLAQQSLDNQYRALALQSQNMQDQMKLDAKRAQINFAFQVAGASLSTISNVSAGVAGQMKANQDAFRNNVYDAYAAGGMTKQEFQQALAYKPSFGELLTNNIDPFKPRQ